MRECIFLSADFDLASESGVSKADGNEDIAVYFRSSFDVNLGYDGDFLFFHEPIRHISYTSY